MFAEKFAIVSLVLIATVLGVLTPSAAVADDSYYRIEISAGPDDNGLARLKLFYQRLLTELKVDDLGFANIGCDKCYDLNEGLPEKTLTFALERDGLNLAAFMHSYHYVQEQAEVRFELFSMSINGSPPPSALCPRPVPSGCRDRAICNMFSGCDKPYGGICQPCQ